MDTGATYNILTRDTYQKLNITVALEKPETSLTSYSGHSTATDGLLTIPLHYDGHVKLCNFMLFTEKHQIFGEPTRRKLNLVRCMNTFNKAEQAMDHRNSHANGILKESQYV